VRSWRQCLRGMKEEKDEAIAVYWRLVFALSFFLGGTPKVDGATPPAPRTRTPPDGLRDPSPGAREETFWRPA
jgi:hypothetical protein